MCSVVVHLNDKTDKDASKNARSCEKCEKIRLMNRKKSKKRKIYKTSDGKEYTFLCYVCEKQFKTTKDLQEHCEKQHDLNVKFSTPYVEVSEDEDGSDNVENSVDGVPVKKRKENTTQILSTAVDELCDENTELVEEVHIDGDFSIKITKAKEPVADDTDDESSDESSSSMPDKEKLERAKSPEKQARFSKCPTASGESSDEDTEALLEEVESEEVDVQVKILKSTIPVVDKKVGQDKQKQHSVCIVDNDSSDDNEVQVTRVLRSQNSPEAKSATNKKQSDNTHETLPGLLTTKAAPLLPTPSNVVVQSSGSLQTPISSPSRVLLQSPVQSKASLSKIPPTRLILAAPTKSIVTPGGSTLALQPSGQAGSISSTSSSSSSEGAKVVLQSSSQPTVIPSSNGGPTRIILHSTGPIGPGLLSGNMPARIVLQSSGQLGSLLPSGPVPARIVIHQTGPSSSGAPQKISDAQTLSGSLSGSNGLNNKSGKSASGDKNQEKPSQSDVQNNELSQSSEAETVVLSDDEEDTDCVIVKSVGVKRQEVQVITVPCANLIIRTPDGTNSISLRNSNSQASGSKTGEDSDKALPDSTVDIAAGVDKSQNSIVIDDSDED